MNDSNDKYRNLLFLVRSHSFSLILLVAGIAWTTMYIRSVLASTDTADLSQPTEMLFAGLALILSAVLAMPAVLDRIPQKAYRVLMAAGVIGAAYFFMASTNSVLDEEQFLADQKAVNAITIQRLTDIRDAQLAYKDVHGEFTDSFDTLLAFINAPLVPLNFSIGSFHDTLPEAMCDEEGYVIRRADVPGVAAELGWDEQSLLDSITADAVAYKVRDTLYTSFFAENFVEEKRTDKKLPKVDLDSLSFSPTSPGSESRPHRREGSNQGAHKFTPISFAFLCLFPLLLTPAIRTVGNQGFWCTIPATNWHGHSCPLTLRARMGIGRV